MSGDSNTLTGAVTNTYTGANTYNGDLSVTNTGATPSSTKPVAGINTCEGSKAYSATTAATASAHSTSALRPRLACRPKCSPSSTTRTTTTRHFSQQHRLLRVQPRHRQVDRKCHMVSASTFDKMCADMKSQRDDMSSDLHAHGSREVVSDNLAADNQVTSADMHTGATLAPATVAP